MRLATACLIGFVLIVSRLAHLDIVWVEEGYPAAAALQILRGKALYRDVWFDKPPLSPYLYLLWGAWTGWPLRLAGIGFVSFCCFLAYRFTADVWTEREGLLAAGLLAFFLTFGIPSAVIALAPDLLMIAPHLAAVWLAWRGKPLLAGLVAGVGLLVNSKAVFVLAACLAFCGAGWPWLLIGFVSPTLTAFAWFGRPYWEEVWQWGAVYASYGFGAAEGAVRTLNWAAFHVVLILGSSVSFWRERRWRFAVWMMLSLAAVAAGWRFFPRYYFQLLPPLVIASARGFWLMTPRWRIGFALSLLIPFARFGPRYVQLAADQIGHRPHRWNDLQLSADSAAAANLLSERPGTLLVWGYRPDIFALTRMQAGTRFLDSQPLTGVLADRHLTNSAAAYPDLAATNRGELAETHPDYIVDGLGLLNHALAITNYPDLREWLADYREIGRTRFSIVYRRRERGQ